MDIASYDIKILLFEDEIVTRMEGTLSLFKDIVNSMFSKTSFALIFTKYDKLKAKLRSSPMKRYFPDYDGGDDPRNAANYIARIITRLSQEYQQAIEVFMTSIVDD